jgi:ubiquitin-like-conjugating enzyme ATG3
MPAMTKSAFAEKGVVTPEEFIVAGDFLVSQARSIHWSPHDRVGVVDADP